MKNPHDIIRRPVLTEKAYTCIADKRYIFEVDVHATKTEIKQAVEAVFAEDGVKVEKVNTLNVYDILNANKLILTKAALALVEEVYA